MVDYGNLAHKAKAMQVGANIASSIGDLQGDLSVFFQKVMACVGDEMSKANLEFRKMGVGTLSRNHLPSFEGVIFLTLGTESLCRVELETKRGSSQITASISGPPNGEVISRKEYLLGPEASGLDMQRTPGAISWTVGARPEQIAEDIISGFVVGKFD